MPTTYSLAIAAMVGLLSGSHAAIWGMYKDSAYEGFSVACFVRSIIIGALAAIGIQLATQLPLPQPGAIVILFGIAYAAERGIVEVWKTFIREEDQSKFFIPMAFSIRGVPVASRRLRILAGAGYVTVVALCLLGFARLDQANAGSASPLTSALVGLVVGVIIAIGGAWKDAPKEGFQLLKFFRSPSMTVLGSLALATLTDSYLYMAIGAIGYERAAVETWKTLIINETAPGKFTGMPIRHPEMRWHRRRAVPVFLGIWVFVLSAAAVATLSQGSGGAEQVERIAARAWAPLF